MTESCKEDGGNRSPCLWRGAARAARRLGSLQPLPSPCNFSFLPTAAGRSFPASQAQITTDIRELGWMPKPEKRREADLGRGQGGAPPLPWLKIRGAGTGEMTIILKYFGRWTPSEVYWSRREQVTTKMLLYVVFTLPSGYESSLNPYPVTQERLKDRKGNFSDLQRAWMGPFVRSCRARPDQRKAHIINHLTAMTPGRARPTQSPGFNVFFLLFSLQSKFKI